MTANKKKKRRKALWTWRGVADILGKAKFKYRLTITNENTLEDIITLRVSKLNGLSVLLSVLTILFLVASLIVAFTPLRNYLPGYMNSEIRAQVVENALRVDSLQQLVDRQNLYIMNIQDIFQGKIKADTIHSIDSLTTVREDSLMERTQREAEFRKQYEETEKYNLTSITSRPDVDGLIFYRPTRGMISSPFNAEKKHFGTDIAANPGESVLATLDGTVILSTYTAETGYLIEVQHNQDFEYYLENLETKEGEKPGLVPDSVYFCLDIDRNIFVGAVNIRHYLNESLYKSGGHIGDGIRPSERRKGYATAMIGLALEKCKELGINKVLMTCDKTNIGSAKSIINNGGVLESEFEEDGVVEQRYWITLVSI